MNTAKTWVAAAGFTVVMLLGAISLSEMIEGQEKTSKILMPIRVDANGDLITSGTQVDDAAFTPASGSVQVVGFEYDDTSPDSINEGDAGAARMSANRNQYITIRDAAGNERGVNVTSGNAAEVDIAEQSLTAVKVSATAAANTLANPMFFRLSADGTNAMAAGYPVYVAPGTSAEFDVDINAQTLTALKVSKDANANATANRIYVASNTDQLGGVAIAVNGGAKSTGVQTVTLATDDPAVTAVEIMDDWDDGSDHAQVDIAAQTLTAVKVSDDASANGETNPIYQQPLAPVFDDDGSANCVAITNGSVQFTLPGNDSYEVCASGNTAYILCGANPTATTAVGNFSLLVGDGQCVGPREYGSAKCAVIGTVSAGFVCFNALDYN